MLKRGPRVSSNLDSRARCTVVYTGCTPTKMYVYSSTLPATKAGILFGHFFKSITSSSGKQVLRASSTVHPVPNPDPNSSTKVRRAPLRHRGNAVSNSRFSDCLPGPDEFNRRICDADDDRGSLRSWNSDDTIDSVGFRVRDYENSRSLSPVMSFVSLFPELRDAKKQIFNADDSSRILLFGNI